jgi:hypothetical protein
MIVIFGFFILVWLVGVGALVAVRPIRSRPDAWPLVAIWPLLGFYVVFILLYEGLAIALRQIREMQR